MKKAILLLPIFFLLVCCGTDEPITSCEGFTEEPTIHFKSNTNDTFGIYFLSVRGIGDTFYSTDQNGIFVPLDMNGDTMTYEFLYDTSSLGFMQLHYTLEQKFCENQDQLNLYFKTAKFTHNTSFINVNTVTNGFKTPLDTNAGYKTFLNNTIDNRYFEIILP